MAKKLICIALVCCMACSLGACGTSTYGVKTEKVLVEQDYSLAFRNNDPIIYYVVAAIKVLAAEGKVDELSTKWFGSRAVQFESDSSALDDLAVPPNRTFTIGVDINSLPLVYISNDTYWGFDIELAIAVADKLGWVLREQTIEKENVYNELASGNIDCAWGGIALDPKEVEEEQYAVYGPYIHNDIIVATRATSNINSKLKLSDKKMCMSSTAEAKEALNIDPSIPKRLGQITRLAGGTAECFENLYAGKCDVVLTDSTALYYFNCH